MDACLLLLPPLLPSWESLTSEKHCFLPPLMIDDIQSAVSRRRRRRDARAGAARVDGQTDGRGRRSGSATD